MAKKSITPDEILKVEYEYAANSAFQANEDRSKVASFFLISVGSLVAAIFGADLLGTAPIARLLLAGLFLVLTLLGLLTVMQLARLREAWMDSAKVMNAVKDYYIANIKDADFEKAFLWRTGSIPPKYKTKSISYYTVLEVALLSGLTFGTAIYFLLIGLAGDSDPIKCIWWLTIGASTLAFLFELFIYKRMLNQ